MVIASASAALVAVPRPAEAFSSYDILGRHYAEHEDIMSVALGCGHATVSPCFQPQSLATLESAVQAPDLFTAAGEKDPAAHCDDGDYLPPQTSPTSEQEGPWLAKIRTDPRFPIVARFNNAWLFHSTYREDYGLQGRRGTYPQSKAEAQANIAACALRFRTRAQGMVDAAKQLATGEAIQNGSADLGNACLASAGPDESLWDNRVISLVNPTINPASYTLAQDPDPQDPESTSLMPVVTPILKSVSPQSLKCLALSQMGRGLHIVQDIYAHSNLVDPKTDTADAQPLLLVPPGLGADPTAVAAVAKMFQLNYGHLDEVPVVPDGLITGCYADPGVPFAPASCAGRVQHGSPFSPQPWSLSKDDPRYDTAHEKFARPGGLFGAAYNLAVTATANEWSQMMNLIRVESATPEQANLAICALTHDNPRTDCDDLAIDTTDLPDATQGLAYPSGQGSSTVQAEASGGVGPYFWSAFGLPSGLDIDEGGNITGTTNAATGVYPVTLSVTDDLGFTQSADVNLQVDPPLPPPPTGTPPPPPAELACAGTCAVTWGDPHLVTFDSAHYNFQQVGEFIAAKSTADDFQIQVRQRPWGTSRTVAINSAIAFSVAGHRVGIYLTGTGGTQTLVDGQVVTVSATPANLPAGGSVGQGAGGTEVVTWPDGSFASVFNGGTYLTLNVSVAPARKGHLVGLLGNADGNAANDFTTRAGVVLPNPPAQADLYGQFSSSWRISQAESLFDYGTGQTTATFTDLAFPYADVTVGGLPASTVTSATATCKAATVTSEPYLDDCILDLAETGDLSLATAAGGAQSFETQGSPASQSITLASGNGTVGAPDPNVTVKDSCTGTATQATIVAPYPGYWAAPLSGTHWDSVNSGYAGCNETFTTTFTLPAGAVAPKITVTDLADNSANVSLNGNQPFITGNVPGQCGGGFAGPPVSGTTTSGLVAGVNTLTFDVDNCYPAAGQNATGLDFTATVTWKLAVTPSVTDTIGVGSQPSGVAADPKTGEVFVTNDGANTVSVIDAGSDTVTGTIPVGNHPINAAVDPDTGKAYVSNYDSGTVSVIDEKTQSVTATVTVGSNPNGIAADPATGLVYVANSGSDSISVIAESTNVVAATIALGTPPAGVGIDSVTGRVFAALPESGSVAVISESTQAETAAVPVGTQPANVSADPGAGEVFVTNQGSGTVSVIDEATNAVTKTIPVAAPNGIAFDTASNNAFVVDDSNNDVAVIDAATDLVTTKITVGTAPQISAADPAAGKVFVTNQGSNSVSVIQTAS
jgi:YVTN family beta-propeller protein